MKAMSGTVDMDDLRETPKQRSELERIRGAWNRRKWLAILVLLVPLAAGSSVIFSLPSLYRSTATVLVERQRVPEEFVRPTVTSELETRLQTISQGVLSRARLEELITRFNLYPDLRRRLPSDEVAEHMRRDIRLEVKSTDARGRQAATVAFALSYKGPDSRAVALVTNTLASYYVEENLRAREREASATTEFLRAQIAETKRRLDEQERLVSEFQRRHLGELPQQMPANLATLETLTTQLRVNSDNQVRASQRRQDLAAQLSEAAVLGHALAPPGTPPGPESPAAHLARLKQELGSARARYTEAHPTVARLKDEIAAAEAELTRARPEADDQAGGPAAALGPYGLRLRESLRAADGELKILRTEEQRLRGAIATYQSRVEHTPRREQEFQELSRDYAAIKELHQSLSKRYEEAQLAESMEQVQKGEQFRILDPAVPRASAAAPNRLRLLLMLVVLSVGAAAGAVVLAEMLDTSVRSVDDLKSFTGVPILVRIPLIVSEADRRWWRLRFRLTAVAAIAALTVVVGAGHFVARGNEQMVRFLDRDRA
jgi:polysaccharide chain length determinant protein (PEP-CTERM system associated)